MKPTVFFLLCEHKRMHGRQFSRTTHQNDKIPFVRKPRTFEEDVRSEIGPSEIGHAVPKDTEAFYRVSLCGVVFDRNLVDEKVFECTFITRGMADQARMRRAVYFFEIALFNAGMQRHKLLNQDFNEPLRVSHMMYTSMISAYRTFSAFLNKINNEMSMYVIALDRLTQAPIVHTQTPLVRRLYVKPDVVSFDMSYCFKCLRIVETVSSGPFTCMICSKS